MSTTYVSFTPAEREQARRTDLAEFLRRQEDDLKREGRGSVWMNGGEKISIQGNLWYNQYTREGGDAIDFARRFFDCPDYPSAVRLLLGADVGVVAVTATQKKKEQKPFALPPANSDMHRIYAYLMKQRGIDRDVIHAFTHAKLLYEEATYLYLRERSNKDGTCFPSVPTASRDTGLSEATVKRAIQDLITAGWLQKEPRLRRNGARSSNLYLLKH